MSSVNGCNNQRQHRYNTQKHSENCRNLKKQHGLGEGKKAGTLAAIYKLTVFQFT